MQGIRKFVIDMIGILIGILTEATIVFLEATILIGIVIVIVILHFKEEIDKVFDDPGFQQVFIITILIGAVILEIIRRRWGKILWQKFIHRKGGSDCL